MAASKLIRNPKYVITISGGKTIIATSNDMFCRNIARLMKTKIPTVNCAYTAINANNRNPQKEFMIKVRKKYQYRRVVSINA